MSFCSHSKHYWNIQVHTRVDCTLLQAEVRRYVDMGHGFIVIAHMMQKGFGDAALHDCAAALKRAAAPKHPITHALRRPASLLVAVAALAVSTPAMMRASK